MTQCYFCKGTVQNQKIRHVHEWGGHVYIFEDVPAEVCQQCGEAYFAPDVLEMMDQIVATSIEPKTTLTVPVYSLA